MEFQPEKESWQSYTERLDLFFAATNVADDKKVTALIMANDPSFYTLLKELSFPINPKTMTFYDVMRTLKRHYVGEKNIFRERKLFYSAVLKPDESINEWYRRLKSLSINCEFGVMLEEILVDKFVCGFEGRILQSFYEHNENLELVDALKIAQLHETELDVDNESQEEELSDSWEDEESQESENEELNCNQTTTAEPQEIEIRQQEEPTQASMQHQPLLMLQQQIRAGARLLTNMFSSQPQPQQRRRIRQHKVSQNHRQVDSCQMKKSEEKQVNQKQKPVPKQVNHQKSQHLKQQKPPHLQKPQYPVQAQNNQQQVKSQHQQPNQHKQTNAQNQKPHTPNSLSKTRPQQQRNQHQSQPLQKPTNQQQKRQPQTIQKSTTIITKTTIKTAKETIPKKGPTKCHKCGKVGHSANICNSK